METKSDGQQTIRLIIPPEFSPSSEVKTPDILKASKFFSSSISSPAALSKYGEVLEIPVNPTITASELCALVVSNAKYKSPLDDAAPPQVQIHLVQVRGGSFENILEPDDLPLQVLEMLENSGRSGEFEFVIKRSRFKVTGSAGKRSEAFSKLYSEAAGAIRSGLLEIYVERMKRWKTRWFVLQDDRLYYYRSHLEMNPLGFIPLRDSTVRIVSACNVQKRMRRKSWNDFKEFVPAVDVDYETNDKMCIEIDTTNALCHLSAPNIVEMDAWINDIIVQSSAHQVNFHFEDISTRVEIQEAQKENFFEFVDLWKTRQSECRAVAVGIILLLLLLI
jgi:hypothetical protein